MALTQTAQRLRYCTDSMRHVRGRSSTRRPKAQLPLRQTGLADGLQSQKGGHLMLSWVVPTRRTNPTLSLHTMTVPLSYFCNSERDAMSGSRHSLPQSSIATHQSSIVTQSSCAARWMVAVYLCLGGRRGAYRKRPRALFTLWMQTGV